MLLFRKNVSQLGCNPPAALKDRMSSHPQQHRTCCAKHQTDIVEFRNVRAGHKASKWESGVLRQCSRRPEYRYRSPPSNFRLFVRRARIEMPRFTALGGADAGKSLGTSRTHHRQSCHTRQTRKRPHRLDKVSRDNYQWLASGLFAMRPKPCILRSQFAPDYSAIPLASTLCLAKIHFSIHDDPFPRQGRNG